MFLNKISNKSLSIQLLIIIILLLSVGCDKNKKPKFYGEISCDAEKFSECTEKVQSNYSNIFLTNKAILTDHFSRSGNHSIETNSDYPVGLVLEINDLIDNDIVEISVWNFSKSGKGSIEISSGNERLFWTDRVSETQTGWDKISMKIEIPPDFGYKDIVVYCRNSSAYPVYFDDFSMKINPPQSIKSRSIEKLKIIVADSFKTMFYTNAESKFRKEGIIENADMFLKGERTRVDIYYNKNCSFHDISSNPSFFVNNQNSSVLTSVKNFMLKQPDYRTILNEKISHSIFSYLGGFSTNIEIVSLILNDQNRGEYILYERPAEQLLIHNKKNSGTIVKLDDSPLKGLYAQIHTKSCDHIYLIDKLFPALDPVPALTDSDYFEESVFLLNIFKSGTFRAEEIFDLEPLASFFASIDFCSASSLLNWENINFYYNSLNNKLEPVIVNCYKEFDTLNVNYPLCGEIFSKECTNLSLLPFHTIFRDVDFQKEYLRKIVMISDSGFLKKWIFDSDKYIKNLAFSKDEKDTLKNHYHHDYFKRANRIKEKIPELFSEVNNENRFTSFEECSKGNCSLKDDLQNQMHELVNAYFYKTGDSLSLKVKSFACDSLKFRELALDNGEIYKLNNYYKLNAHKDEPDSVIVKFGEDFDPDSVIIQSDNVQFRIKIRDWNPAGRMPEYFRFKQLSKKQMNFSPFQKKSKSKLVLYAGNYRIKDTLVISDNFNTVIYSDAKIDLQKNAQLVFLSSIKMKAKAGKWIEFSCSDSSDCNIRMYNSGNDSELLKVVFRNFKSENSDPVLCVTESELKLNDCLFNDIMGDALLVKNSKLHISESQFKNVLNNAITLKHGTIDSDENYFEYIGNNALVLQNSTADVKYSRINNCDNSAIYVSDFSNIGLNGCFIQIAKNGVCAVNGSNVDIEALICSGCNHALIAYSDYPNYGNSKIVSRKIQLYGNKNDYLIEEASVLVYGTDTIVGQEKISKEIFN